MHAHPDLNRDELRRELRAIDADNKAVMPRWYDALRQIVGGGTRMSTDEKAALLGVPAPGPTQLFKLGGATIIGAAVLAACGDTDDDTEQRHDDHHHVDDGRRRRASMDLALARTAASLEKLAVDTYQTGIDSGPGHHDGHRRCRHAVPVPPPGAPRRPERRHQRRRRRGGHRAQRGGVRGARSNRPSTAAKAEADIVQIAFDLESAAAQTYVFAGGDAQHARRCVARS